MIGDLFDIYFDIFTDGNRNFEKAKDYDTIKSEIIGRVSPKKLQTGITKLEDIIRYGGPMVKILVKETHAFIKKLDSTPNINYTCVKRSLREFQRQGKYILFGVVEGFTFLKKCCTCQKVFKNQLFKSNF